MSATDLDFRIFDCDNHYYEAPDAFTRHIDPAYRKRAMQWAQIDGRKRLLVGGKVNRFIPNPTWDPVAKPGRHRRVLPRPQPEGRRPPRLFGELDRLADHPEYRNRDARSRSWTPQGIGGRILLPTLGVGMEQASWRTTCRR